MRFTKKHIKRELKRSFRRIALTRPPLREDPGLEGERMLHICGLHRSGTSIMHKIVRGHPDVSGGRSGWVVGAPPGGWPDTGHHGKFALDPRSHMVEVDAERAASDRDVLSRQWGRYFDLNKKILVRKAPQSMVRTRYLQSLYPGSRFLLIARHPLAVTYATLRKEWSKNSLPELMRHWVAAYSTALADLSQLEHVKVIRYEDFGADPQATLDDIFSYLGLPSYIPSESVSDHNGRYFGMWEEEEGPVAEQMREAVAPAEELLAKFGYGLRSPYAGPWKAEELLSARGVAPGEAER